jgi:hypothetical protein
MTRLTGIACTDVSSGLTDVSAEVGADGVKVAWKWTAATPRPASFDVQWSVQSTFAKSATRIKPAKELSLMSVARAPPCPPAPLVLTHTFPSG